MQATSISPMEIIQAPRKTTTKEIPPFEVRYIRSLNLITVKGWSMKNDIHKKYAQLLIDIENHLEKSESLNLHFKYEDLNSASLRYLHIILNTLNGAHKQGKKIALFWNCMSDKEDQMIETGMELAKECKFRFQFSYL